jgi:hypothetical protein
MNFYRFKIELSAWISKTALCVLTTLVVGRVFFAPQDGYRSYDLSLRMAAEHDWIFPVVLVGGSITLWVCYWKVMRILRSDRRYRKP